METPGCSRHRAVGRGWQRRGRSEPLPGQRVPLAPAALLRPDPGPSPPPAVGRHRRPLLLAGSYSTAGWTSPTKPVTFVTEYQVTAQVNY